MQSSSRSPCSNNQSPLPSGLRQYQISSLLAFLVQKYKYFWTEATPQPTLSSRCCVHPSNHLTVPNLLLIADRIYGKHYCARRAKHNHHHIQRQNHSSVPRGLAIWPGLQFTCVNSTKVQILTPSSVFVLTFSIKINLRQYLYLHSASKS